LRHTAGHHDHHEPTDHDNAAATANGINDDVLDRANRRARAHRARSSQACAVRDAPSSRANQDERHDQRKDHHDRRDHDTGGNDFDDSENH